MNLAHNALIVVADGRKMLFFRNEGDAEYPNLVVEYGEENPNPADRDQKTDAQGQRPSSATPGQESTSETDYHKQAEDLFAAHAAEELKVRALRNDFEELIIVAAPKVLGEMRKHYHKEVSSRLKGEVAKDLTGHPPDQIETILKDHS
ncbi:MAG: host attachment family protein [Sphingobium sp.]|uniref:host attachment family protein n=1 Tax=Sphingobium sp. TaxID=1912891 RepID=UPI0029A8ACCE|nr:host attachment family protein [Sphingobium sp.]MDX3911083.1 host attachment family protein [Sphingobium sp.]